MEKDKILDDLLKVIFDNKGYDIVYLDISSVNPLAQYYVICSVDSNRQALAIAHYLADELAKNDINVKHIEGNNTSEWILVDGLDYIIHIFVKEARNRYGLEKMWSDLKIIKVDN